MPVTARGQFVFDSAGNQSDHVELEIHVFGVRKRVCPSFFSILLK